MLPAPMPASTDTDLPAPLTVWPVALIGAGAAVCGIAAAVLWPSLAPAVGNVPAGLLLALGGGIGLGLIASRICRTMVHRRTELVAAAHAEASELSRQEARLHAERMRAIVATATEGIVTIDQRGRILTMNSAAERMFGWSADEILGRNVALLMPQPYRGEHDDYIRRYLDTGKAKIIGIGREVVGERRDGSTFPMDLSIGEGFVGDERFFTALVRDITDRKEMQAKLAQTERLAAVGELAAGVAHEVNNPINTIINSAQLILDGDEPRANAAVIVEEGDRIAMIVKDLLRFARDDRDSPQATSIHEVVERTMRLIGENFKRHGIRIDVDVPEDAPAVLSRPQQLQQVLLNLILNAKDALLGEEPLREGRRVALRTEEEDGGVAILVGDNGPGIPPHLGDRVFEPFVTTKRAKGGSGLGLSISRSIVEGYGGRLTVRSAPGQGAEFRIWLPLAVEGRY